MNKDKILEYSTLEQLDRCMNMTDEEMYNNINDIYDSEVWIAILKYVTERINICQSVINSTDPIESPSKILRYQGMMDGLVDIFNYYTERKSEIKNIKKQIKKCIYAIINNINMEKNTKREILKNEISEMVPSIKDKSESIGDKFKKISLNDGSLSDKINKILKNDKLIESNEQFGKEN